jgi:L-alanine-DL-glutamate epimerase-like enolase superfamily enzyme
VQITAVETIPYAVPYRKPNRFASGTVEQADNVLVRIHTDEGLFGQAEAQPRPYTYGETQASIVSAIQQHLAPALEGLEVLAPARAHERCSKLAGNQVARGAVDLAIWDLFGKALEQPCRVLLGGYARDVEVAHMISFDEPLLMAQEALEVHERYGVQTFKVKVGRDVALDVAACRAIREVLPEAKLYVDANRGWSYEQACRAGSALAELEVVAIEEPISVDDRKGRVRLAKRWDIPLIGDESCISLAHVARALDEGAVGAVSIKTARTGFTESRQILAMCVGHDTRVILGSQYEGGAGVLATAAFAAAFPETAGGAAELMNAVELADDLLVVPIEVREGRFAPPDIPGLGIDIDEDKLAFYRLDEEGVVPAAL